MSRGLWEITNRVYGYTIPYYLYLLRDRFCRTEGTLLCTGCPIYKRFYPMGYSCNGALNAFPQECQKIIEEAPR